MPCIVELIEVFTEDGVDVDEHGFLELGKVFE